MRQHAHTQLRFLWLAFLMPATLRVWAADLTGTVTKIDAGLRSITLVPPVRKMFELPTVEYSITLTPSASLRMMV